MALQVINYKVFHGDGRNSTRITLLVKEVMFLGHSIMLIWVTDVVKASFSPLFSSLFGMFYFVGLSCWFFVFLRGLYSSQQP